MADDVLVGLGPPGALPRPRFEPGDYLAAADLMVEQRWRLQRLRRHNRQLHGWGVVCGLGVAPALEAARPWTVIVCPGYAVGPYGDEILVECQARVDLREWLWARPSDKAQVAYVGIRARESSTSDRAYRTAECNCEDRQTHPSRIADGWRIDVLWTAPDAASIVTVDLCHDLPPCVPCPASAHVLLAAVRVPADEGSMVMRVDIDLSVRAII